MSFSDVTRNCFLNGHPPTKWYKLCQLLSKRNSNHVAADHEMTSVNMLNSVLLLCNDFTGHPDLRQYLEVAAQNMPLSLFVSTFLEASRSVQLHSPITLHLLCSITLRTHYGSGLSPLGSLVSFSATPHDIFAIVQDALSLTRVSYELPESPASPVVLSSSELLVLLLSCISDLSQIPTGLVLSAYAAANELLQVCRQNYKLSNAIENFVMSLSIIIGDDAKIEQEVQMMHQLQLGRDAMLVPSTSTDIVTLSLAFQDMVLNKSSEYGASSTQAAASCLLAIFRWNSTWTPSIFYTQLMVSSLTCLTQASAKTTLLWRSFLVSRLPKVLHEFEHQQIENSHSVDWRNAAQLAFAPVSRGSELIRHCNKIGDLVLREVESTDKAPFSFSQELILNFCRDGILDPFSSGDVLGQPPENIPSIAREAQEVSLEPEAYLESKLGDPEGPDFATWAKRLWVKEISSHELFSQVVQKRFIRLAQGADLEALSHLCLLLMSNDFLLDLLALHTSIQELLVSALVLLETANCETVGDPQSAFTQIGKIIHFSQIVIFRFNLGDRTLDSPSGTISANWILLCPRIYHHPSLLSPEETAALAAWHKVLFSLENEGIADSMLRVTSAKTLIKVVPTLLFTVATNKPDLEVLNNAIAFFLTPLLNWLLPTILKFACRELCRFAMTMPIYLHFLKFITFNEACPKSALHLCRSDMLDVIGVLESTLRSNSSFHSDAIRLYEKLSKEFGLPPDFLRQPRPRELERIAWFDRRFQPRVMLREAFKLAVAGGAPSFDLEHCLRVVSPLQLLDILWSEIVSTASLVTAPGSTDLDIWRRISTYILTYPRPPRIRPLLPIFFHKQVPSLLLSNKAPMQPLLLTILATMMSSALVAGLQTEIALRTVAQGNGPVLGESVTATARKTAAFLRSYKASNSTCAELSRQLNMSASFVAAFPFFLDTENKGPST